MSKLIHKELEFAFNIETLKHELNTSLGFNAQALFKEVDDQGTNYIDASNLKRFLMKFGYLPNDNLLLSVIRRIDLDGDARLNFNEFMDIVRPQEKSAPRKK